jgi:hypothetical protein
MPAKRKPTKNRGEAHETSIPLPSPPDSKAWDWPEFEVKHAASDTDTPNPPLDFWVFETGDLNGDQLRSCVAYEYARSTPWIVKAFHDTKAGNSPPAGVEWRIESNGDWVLESHESSIFEGHWFKMPKGFPDKPYLRTARNTVWHWNPECAKDGRATLEETDTPPSQPNANSPGNTGYLTVSFEINWEAPDKVIKRNFAEWLDAKRKETGSRTVRMPRVGKQELEARLKALSIFRLFAYHNFTRTTLQDFVAYFDPDRDLDHLDRDFASARNVLLWHFNAGQIPKLPELLEKRRK